MQPTLHVPVDEKTVMSTEDRGTAGRHGGSAAAAGRRHHAVRTARVVPMPKPASALTSGARFLEDAAREQYDPAQFAAPGTTTYHRDRQAVRNADLGYAWCAADLATVEENFSQINLSFVLDGKACRPVR